VISYNDIQALIAEIDGVLPRQSERVETAEGSLTEDDRIESNRQGAVLEKVRGYLLALRNQIEVSPSDSSQLQGEDRQTANAIASAVMAQLNVRRQDWLQPLHLEVADLRRQRESLLQEIRALEGKHLQLMSDFLQILLGRCSKALQHEFALSLEKFAAQLAQLQDPRDEKATFTPLKHIDRLQKMRSLQQQADVLVLDLDRTFHKVFESLTGDMQSYHQSLSRGIEEMHALGQEGQNVLAAYVQRLNPEMAAQIQPLAAIEAPLRDRPLDAPSSQPNDSEAPSSPNAAMFPFAGMEIPPASTTQDWELDSENESLEPVDALFQVDLEGEIEADEGLEDWEAWDEHLFHSDELMQSGEESIPIVLTLKEAELEELAAEEPPVPDLFAGLADPAIATEEPAVMPDLAPDTPSSTVEVELFGEPPREESESIAIEADIAPEEEQVVLETNAQSLDEIVGETIASLTELLEEKSEQLEPEEEVVEEETLVVGAGETLLATDEVKRQPQTDLETLLDSGQLQTLAEDLANFEGKSMVSEVEETSSEPEIQLPEASPSPEIVIEAKEEADLTKASDREIHLDAPEIDAAMEIDESFEEAFEEEIISEEDEDWLLAETAIATDNDAIALPPSAILTSLADLQWQEQSPVGTLPATSLPSERVNSQQLEIVVDDDFESHPPKRVLTSARMSKNPVPAMRSPQPEKTASANDDLWDNSESDREETSRYRNTSEPTQNSHAIENTSSSVTEIVTDPWSETPNSSERKQDKG
jgi:hypothetical protein